MCSFGIEQRQCGFCDVHQSFQIGIDHRFPIIQAGILEKITAQGQSCVVDQDIKGAPGFRNGGNLLENGCPIHYIEGQGEDVYAIGRR